MSKPTKRRRCECTPNECDCDSPLLSVSKPKLPKVWVGFKNADQAIDGAYFKLPWRGFDGVTRFRLYAPVQKPKVCVWKDDTEDEFWRAPCGKNALYPPGFDMTYCPNCGGKIKVTK